MYLRASARKGEGVNEVFQTATWLALRFPPSMKKQGLPCPPGLRT